MGGPRAGERIASLMKRYLLDSNVILRHLLADIPEHSDAAGKVIAAASDKKFTLILTSLVTAECVFMLESFYKRSKPEIARSMSFVLQQPGVESEEVEVLLAALKHYAMKNSQFADAYLLARSASEDNTLLSFDAKMKTFPGASVVSPRMIIK